MSRYFTYYTDQITKPVYKVAPIFRITEGGNSPWGQDLTREYWYVNGERVPKKSARQRHRRKFALFPRCGCRKYWSGK